MTITDSSGKRRIVMLFTIAVGLMALIALPVAAWNMGRASRVSEISRAAASTEAEFPSYDLGPATRKPAPTGKVREFNLVAKEARIEIAPGVTVNAITYNGQVPGPLIRVTEGDTVRVTFKNELGEATSIHWHGLHVPNSMDGVPPMTQREIGPGQSYTYEFTASHAGTFMYHSHQNAVEQIDRGLYGPLIIDPKVPPAVRFDKEFTMMLSAWNTLNPVDMQSMPGMPSEHHMMGDGQPMEGHSQDMGVVGASGDMDKMMEGMMGTGTSGTPEAGNSSETGTSGTPGSMGSMMEMMYNYFTINGKAFPANEAWKVKEGDLVRVRIMNISNLTHPMHLHGHDFTVVAKDGEPIRPEVQQTMNTLSVDAGETYDIVFRADNPGFWMFHCHELHHTENDGVEPGGLIQVIEYEGFSPPRSEGKPQPTAIATATPAGAPGGSEGMVTGAIWVANEHGNSLSVIDASTNRMVATLTGIEGPHNVQVAPDGKSIWAVSGHSNLVIKVDPQTYRLVGTAPTGKEPAHVVLTPDGKTAYITNGADGTVTVIDAVTLKVVKTIRVGQYPHGLRPNPDGKWLYVANVKSNSLSVIDTSTNEKVADIEVGSKPVQVGFSPDGKYVYFSLNGEDAVGRVEVATRRMLGKVSVGDGPVQVYVTPDGKYILAANQGTEEKPSTTVSVIDARTFTVTKTIETGRGAHGVVIEPAGRYAYVTNLYADDVAVLDLTQLRLVATVAVGDAPNGISISPLAPATPPSPEIRLDLPQGGGMDDHNDGGKDMHP